MQALEDVLGANLREVEKFGATGDLLKRGHHQLRVGKSLFVEVDLDLQELFGKAQVIEFDGVFQRGNVLLDCADSFEEVGEVLSFPPQGVIEFDLILLPVFLIYGVYVNFTLLGNKGIVGMCFALF